MEAISTGSDARFYFQVGKMKISEGFKHLQDLVEWCKNNSSPENDRILHDTVTYLQSLQPQIQEIESAAHQGGATPASFNVHGTDLQRGQVIESLARQGDAFVSNPHINEQEITQIREQNVNFKPIPSPEINVGMNKKRKLRSDVWNHFTKYENKDKEVKAQCHYCKKNFDGSSKNGTTHLKNHLKSCLKNQDKVTDKAKELSVVDQELNHSNLARKFLKYGWDNITDNIMKVYKEEKNKLHRYLDKLSGRFNVIIGNDIAYGVEFVKIWFIDDEWKLKTRIIHLKNYDDYKDLSKEDSLKWLIQGWNIDKRILSIVDHREDSLEDLTPQLTNWLKERVSLPVIGNYETNHHLLFDIECEVDFVESESDISSEVRKLREYYMTSSNKFDIAAKQVESMGKKVTSNYDDVRYLIGFQLLDWAMGYKEVFCELKRIDPDFTSSNFDWDDATSLHSFWVLLHDIQNDIWTVRDDSKLANECFPTVYHFFSKMLRLKNTENQYFRFAALLCREIFDKYCNNSKLVIAITAILDPRFKLDIVEKFYNEVFENERDLHFKKIMDDVTNIYNEYARDVNNSSMDIANANEAASSKSEFERYLADPMVSPHEGFDILEWWRANSPTYPTLAAMARDFLSIPIVNDLDMCFEDGLADIYRRINIDFNVYLKDVLAYIKVWLNDHDCM
ncbi:zinc finger BED domain-containing protein RICESLEEPER 3-like [Mangifera indica]|uniref:zinc finger BED domain-containing protein RICESLEEPER 3-like n=1 Tax=Mangifera indica TaxID=29780 RepID=UPI001CFB9E0E|nr:zinc finger BED domain-containing protein RICESLEEPER 3-like [Mangifera indica]